MESRYKQSLWILNCIENELRNRSIRSEWISCPSFLPVMQSLVSPSKESRRSSHSKYHSKQRKSPSSSSVKSYGYDEPTCYSRVGTIYGKSVGEYGVSSLSPYVKRESDMEGSTPLVSSPSVCESELSSSRKHPPVSSLHYVSPPLTYCRAIEVMIRVGSSGIHSEGELIRCCEEYLKKENGRVGEVGDVDKREW